MSDMSIQASFGMSSGAMTSSLQQQKFGAELIDKTLTKLNMTAGSAMSPKLNPDFEMQQSVLGSAYTGKGTALDMSV